MDLTSLTLTGDDLGWMRGFNRDENRLDVAVQLCTLPWPGWKPDDLTGCPDLARRGTDRLAGSTIGIRRSDRPKVQPDDHPPDDQIIR